MNLAVKTADTAISYHPPKILVVDDELRMCDSLEVLLSGEGYEVHTGNSGKEAIEHLSKNGFDLVLLDIVMPEMDGHEVVRYVNSQDLDSLVIFMTGHASVDSAIEALRGGAYDYLRKPFEPEELLRTVRSALDEQRLKSERKQVEEGLKESTRRVQVAYDQCVVYAKQLTEEIKERKRAEEALRKAGDELERRVEERTAELVRATEQLKLELTQRKQAEKKVRESEERLQSIVDKTTAVIYLKDLHGRYILVNRQFEKLLDMSREDIIGKTGYDLLPKEVADKARANDQKAVEAGTAVEFEEVAELQDGLHTYISIKVPLLDSAGRAYGVCGISTDITERKKAEEVLQQRTRDLGERVKELNCLCGVSQLSRAEDISLEATLQAMVDGIPSAWQYPEITCVRVVLEGQEFTTENFRQTIHKQASKIIIGHEHAGTLEVFYLEEKPECDEGPFLKEERSLLEAIADQLARLIERKRAEEEIRSLAKFPSENPNPVLRIAKSGTILYANEAGLSLLNAWGCNTGQPLPDEWRQFVLDVLSSGSSKNTEVEFGDRVFSLTFAPVVDGGHLNLYGFEITRRKRAEEQIRRLSHELLVAQESEWQRISRELHDVVGQELSALKIGIDTFFDNQPEATPETRQRLSEFSKILKWTIASVRDLSRTFRSTGLDKRGLVSTVRLYCEEFSRRKGLKVDFFATGIDESKLDFDMKINLYRIIQEALSNVKKHGDANHVTIRLLESFSNIILCIEDDGTGFDVQDRLISAANEGRMGLRVMEERVALLDGMMKMESCPNQGTKILVEVPYKGKRIG